MEETKQIKLIWPVHLWKRASLTATKQGTSLQTLITEAFLEKYGIPHWRKGSRQTEMVEDILKHYSYVPDDVQELLIKLEKENLNINKTAGKLSDLFPTVDEDMELLLMENK